MLPRIVKSAEIALPQNVQKAAASLEKKGLNFVTNKVNHNIKVGLSKDNFSFAKFDNPISANTSVEKGAIGSGKDLASAFTNLLEQLSGKKVFFEGAKNTKINVPFVK